jgi:superfamily I DNA and/or RNA helicase
MCTEVRPSALTLSSRIDLVDAARHSDPPHEGCSSRHAHRRSYAASRRRYSESLFSSSLKPLLTKILVLQSQQARKERLHVSLFERLMSQRCLSSSCPSMTPADPLAAVKSVLLDTQYRMRPAISGFPNNAFYHSALQDAPSVATRPRPPLSKFLTSTTGSLDGSPVPAVFITHDHPEEYLRRSLVNRREVDLIVEIIGDLLKRNPNLLAQDIGVISPYASQTRLLAATFEDHAYGQLVKTLGHERASQLSQVEINTVDGFQGREKDVIVLSTVRSNEGGHIGFLTDKRRLNVALTRAKDAIFVVGNERTLQLATVSEWGLRDVDADGGIWRRYLAWMSERALVRKWVEGS